ncbi:hypothetical protein TNCV_361191 [Trichonephila clavipes]|nr:hypothetical protein TNCV_361191 [Trichonephila clavipes]
MKNESENGSNQFSMAVAPLKQGTQFSAFGAATAGNSSGTRFLGGSFGDSRYLPKPLQLGSPVRRTSIPASIYLKLELAAMDSDMVRALDFRPNGLWVRNSTPSNTLGVHPEHVLVKSVGPIVLWAVAAETTGAGGWRIFPSSLVHV